MASLAELLGMMMGGGQGQGPAGYGSAIGAMARGMGGGYGGQSRVVGQGQDAGQWFRRMATGQGPQSRQPVGRGTAGLRDFVGNDMWSRAYGQQPRVVGQNFSDADKWRIAQGGWGAQHVNGGAPQPQLPPIERHAFPVGDWGGMHAALAARGNRPMGGGYGQPQQQPQRSLMPIGGGMSSLASLLGGGY